MSRRSCWLPWNPGRMQKRTLGVSQFVELEVSEKTVYLKIAVLIRKMMRIQWLCGYIPYFHLFSDKRKWCFYFLPTLQFGSMMFGPCKCSLFGILGLKTSPGMLTHMIAKHMPAHLPCFISCISTHGGRCEVNAPTLYLPGHVYCTVFVQLSIFISSVTCLWYSIAVNHVQCHFSSIFPKDGTQVGMAISEFRTKISGALGWHLWCFGRLAHYALRCHQDACDDCDTVLDFRRGPALRCQHGSFGAVCRGRAKKCLVVLCELHVFRNLREVEIQLSKKTGGMND